MKTKHEIDQAISKLEDALKILRDLRRSLPSEAPAVQESFSFITKPEEEKHTYKAPTLRTPDPGKLPWED